MRKGDRVTHFLRPDEVFEVIDLDHYVRTAKLQRANAHPDDRIEPFWVTQLVLQRSTTE